MLLHNFKQGTLHFGRGAIDLVGQQQIGEDRAERGVEFAGLLVVDARADQVGRHQVGGELDALEVAADRFRQRLDGHRLGQARHALDQDMPARQQGHHQPFQQVVLPDDHLFYFVQHAFHRQSVLGIIILIHLPAPFYCLSLTSGNLW